jgi:transcriptional regulator
MYEPAHFKIEDRAALFEVIRAHPLAQLITAGPGGLMANPIPFVLTGEPGHEVLRAHLARPNPQWQELKAGAEPLVIFQSVEHYVSPSWYATKAETHKVVPTWNYIAVHVQGTVTLHEDVAWLETHLTQLTDVHEAAQAHPWAMHDAPREYLEAQMRGIVGITVRIDALEGKYKLSQNRSDADIAGVVHGLSELATPAARATAAEVARRKPAR